MNMILPTCLLILNSQFVHWFGFEIKSCIGLFKDPDIESQNAGLLTAVGKSMATLRSCQQVLGWLPYNLNPKHCRANTNSRTKYIKYS